MKENWQEWLIERKKLLIICGVGLAALLTTFYLKSGAAAPETPAALETSLSTQRAGTGKESSTSTSENSNWFADVKGAVKKPGVYPITSQMRVENLIALAGGAMEEADLKRLNLAAQVADQMVVYVPKVGEEVAEEWTAPVDAAGSAGSAGSSENSDGKINLNTATAAELQTLNGIGEKKAEAIIEYREKNGSFQAVEDLKKVSGIGEATFTKLEELITIN